MQFVRFLLVGLCNTVVGMSCIFLAMWLFEIDYRVANAIGYAVGCGVAFLLNRSWTFEYQGAWRISLARWIVVVAASYGSNLVTVIALHQGLQVDTYLAQLGGIVVYTACAFLGGRFFVFRDLRSTSMGRAL